MMCEFLFDSLNFAVQSRGILVIMKNHKSLFAKKIDLGSIFNFVKGFLTNVLIIIILVALLQFSPKIL